MDWNPFQSTFLCLSIILFITLTNIPDSSCDDDLRYTNCSQRFECGSFSDISYPFYGGNRADYCGRPGFKLDCQDHVPLITVTSNTFRIIDINPQNQTLKLARDDYWTNIYPQHFYNTTLNFSLFSYTSGLRNVTSFYGCTDLANNRIPGLTGPSDCNINSASVNVFYVLREISSIPSSGRCNGTVSIPVVETAAEAVEKNLTKIQDALDGGFGIQWIGSSFDCSTCMGSGGQGGYNQTTSQFTCFCHDGPISTACASRPVPSITRTDCQALIAAISTTLAVTVAVTVLRLCWVSRSKLLIDMVKIFKGKKTEPDERIEAFFMNYGSLAPKRYSYSDIKRMTNLFTDKLGQGGYGCVYKGRLPNGHLTAVKILSESKGNGEEFINEVASISRTSHVNIVTLVGFCFENRKRALIYQFMPNGSLDKLIYREKSSNLKSDQTDLDWKALYEIAIGIARGLEYLHRGCNTRILHFDIKPHNILLDENFVPKISDFGLARICKRNESIVSTIGARGTCGYMAPEVFCRNFGRISFKSDVYSYGMMVLEMVGGRKNLDVGISHTSEIYFPQWIYKQVKIGEGLNLHGIVAEEEDEKARKMIIVSLWCIQSNPSDRPSMTKVIDMLEGSLQSLQIPPKPFLSSPTRSP